MRALLLTALAASGCGALLPFPARTPDAVQSGMPVAAHSIEYDVLGQTNGRVCLPLEELLVMRGPTHPDPATVGHGATFERAKFEAIKKVKNADGLVGVSATVEILEGKECVTVQGRAYTITAMRAGSPIEKAGARSAKTPFDQ